MLRLRRAALNTPPHHRAAPAPTARVVGCVGDQAVGGQDQAGDRAGVLQRQPRHLGRVDHAHLQQVAVFARRGVVAEGRRRAIRRRGAARPRARRRRWRRCSRSGSSSARATMRSPQSWSSVAPFSAVEHMPRAQQRHRTAGHDAFLDRRACGVQRVFDADLAFLQLGLGGGADLDQRHAARQLGGAFVELLAVVVAGRGLALLADGGDALGDQPRVAGAADQRACGPCRPRCAARGPCRPAWPWPAPGRSPR